MKAVMVKVLGNHRHVGLSPAPRINEWLRDLDEPERYAQEKQNNEPPNFTRP
jgi:hypothetical protein